MAKEQTESIPLRRSLGLWSLAIFGIGDILGAGIYGLVGNVAAEAGWLAWASFLIAMLTAGLTGLSYAELATRHPYSAGEAKYCLAAFRRPWLAFLVGWMVFWSGVISMSAVAHACGNYVQAVWPQVPAGVVWFTFVVLVSGINCWGIRQSSWMNIAFTLIEISGLVLIVIAGLSYATEFGIETDWETPTLQSVRGAFGGATLAFFAYIGFEDMINLAEEVESPARVYPKAIPLAILFCGTLYLLVSLACLAVLPAGQLGKSQAPLLDVIRIAAPFVPAGIFAGIALVAVANTGLLNSIMASRLLYGMARQGLLPKWLSAVHPGTKTPHRAVLALACVSGVLIVSGTLSHLASTTSWSLLLVFALVNLSLIRVRLRDGRHPETFSVPLFIPFLAVAACLGLMAFADLQVLLWGAVILAVGGVMALVYRPQEIESS